MLLKTCAELLLCVLSIGGRRIQNTGVKMDSVPVLFDFIFLDSFLFLIKAITIALLLFCHLWNFRDTNPGWACGRMVDSFDAVHAGVPDPASAQPWMRDGEYCQWMKGLMESSQSLEVSQVPVPILLQRTLWASSSPESLPLLPKIKRPLETETEGITNSSLMNWKTGCINIKEESFQLG